LDVLVVATKAGLLERAFLTFEPGQFVLDIPGEMFARGLCNPDFSNHGTQLPENRNIIAICGRPLRL
jgi:hypothetical protein